MCGLKVLLEVSRTTGIGVLLALKEVKTVSMHCIGS